MRSPALIARNLRRRPLATALTTLSVALGVGLFAAIGALRRSAQEGFQRSAALCDMVVGAKGSPLQLVLNALYHVGTSPGNVPFAVYEEVHAAPGVLWAVPLAVGDSYEGQRIVGTTSALFEKTELPGLGRLRFAEGGPFAYTFEELVEFHHHLEAHRDDHGHDHHGEVEGLFVAVAGAQAARAAGLRVGSTFVPAHDVQGGPGAEQHEDAPTRVVGVLEPTGTPLDRAIYMPLGAFYAIEGHQPAEGSTFGGTRDPLGLSAVLVRTNPNAGFYGLSLWRKLNDRLDAQAARPADEVRNLFAVVGNVDTVLRAVAALVVAVALAGVLVAIYNTMGARRREFAVLRALGAHRRTVLALVMGESAAIASLGGVLGLILAWAGIAAASGRVRELTGVAVNVAPGAPEVLLLIAVTAVGALAGLIPALSAYRTEAARHLAGGAA